MAPCRRRRFLRSNSVLVSVWDHDVGYLVFRFDVKRLFSDEDYHESKRRSRCRGEVLPLPRSPVACFRRPLRFPIDLAASPGGDKIIAATKDGHIMVYDTTRSQCTYDHHLRCWKCCPHLVLTLSSRPSSSGAAERHRRDDDVSMLIATGRPDFVNPEPSFEALRLTSDGRLHPLPVPPPLLSLTPPLPANWRCYGDRAQIKSYFVASGRVWLSVGGAGEGTYSLDMAAPNIKLGWRREGVWVLPLQGRAVYAPDLGRLLLGFSPELRALCAIDMDVKPPVIRQHWAWHTLLPTEDEGYNERDDYLSFGLSGLAYLGGGRLCLSCSSPYLDQGRRMILGLTAVELTMSNGLAGELLLRKGRSRCYRLPPRNQEAIVLPVL